jgi:hypothetical protein
MRWAFPLCSEAVNYFVTQDFAHTLASYSEKQFQDAIIKDFNQARRAKKLEAIKVVADSHLRKAACSQDMDTDKMIQSLPGAASLFVFSLFAPGTLPGDLRMPAVDETLDRMNIGVCLQTGGKDGFSKYWVIIAFYRPSN